MVSYILRRVLSTLPVMGIVALFVFSLLYIAPGDPAAVIAGDQASPADVERIRQGLGLDRPFLVQFGTWLWNILHGDLGTSIFTNLPVSAMIAQRIEPTLSLMALTPNRVFATGGIGGVHRESHFDESADLAELARTPVIVVCAGAKSILDLQATAERLESLAAALESENANA